MSEPNGIWFKHLCGEEREHWHDHLGGGRYAAISRCGNKRQDAQAIAAWAAQVADGRVVVGQSMRCSRCWALVATDQQRWRERARNEQRSQVTAWADDAAVAEARHGAARDASVMRLVPDGLSWINATDIVTEEREIAKKAWMSGWDAAVKALKGGDS